MRRASDAVRQGIPPLRATSPEMQWNILCRHRVRPNHRAIATRSRSRVSASPPKLQQDFWQLEEIAKRLAMVALTNNAHS